MRSFKFRLLLTLFTAASLSACSVKTDCEKAVDHIIMVVSKDPAVPEDKRAAMQNFKTRKTILEQCYQDFRPEGGIQCVMQANTLEQVNGCRAKMRKDKP